jgi:hypothetical protein
LAALERRKYAGIAMRVRSEKCWPFAVVLLAASLGGCGGNDAMAKELAALRTEVTSLRASAGTMSERLDALEIRGGALTTAEPPREAEARSYDKPELPTVKLTPEGSRPETAEAPLPPQTGPRVRIKSTPNGIVQEETTAEELPPVDLNRIKPKPKPEPKTEKKTEKK